MLKLVTGGLGVLVLFAGVPARADFLTNSQTTSEFAQFNSFLGQVISDLGSSNGVRSLQQDLTATAGSSSFQTLLSQLASDFSNAAASINTPGGLSAYLNNNKGWKADVIIAVLLYEFLLNNRTTGDPSVVAGPAAISAVNVASDPSTGHHHHHHHHHHHDPHTADVAPEPGSLTLLALGLGLGGFAWRRRLAAV